MGRSPGARAKPDFPFLLKPECDKVKNLIGLYTKQMCIKAYSRMQILNKLKYVGVYESKDITRWGRGDASPLLL